MFSYLLHLVIHRLSRLFCVFYPPVYLIQNPLWLANWKVNNIMYNKNLADSYIQLIIHLIYWQRKPKTCLSAQQWENWKVSELCLQHPQNKATTPVSVGCWIVSLQKLIYKICHTILISVYFCESCALKLWVQCVRCSSKTVR